LLAFASKKRKWVASAKDDAGDGGLEGVLRSWLAHTGTGVRNAARLRKEVKGGLEKAGG